jgi:hypothetical protein
MNTLLITTPAAGEDAVYVTAVWNECGVVYLRDWRIKRTNTQATYSIVSLFPAFDDVPHAFANFLTIDMALEWLEIDAWRYPGFGVLNLPEQRRSMKR